MGTACRRLPQLYAQRLEERGGPFGRKRPQHAADDTRRTAPEIALGDDTIRHVATRTTAYQDLGADLRRAVQATHVQMRRRALREYCCGQPGRADANDDRCHAGCQVAGWLDSWDKSANRRSGTRHCRLSKFPLRISEMPSNFAILQTNDSASQQPSYPVTFAGDVIGGITTFFHDGASSSSIPESWHRKARGWRSQGC